MNIAEAEKMAQELFKQHNVNVVFKWDRATRRFGQTKFMGGVPLQISLSKPLTEVNTAESVRATLLHEIAHVLAGAKAGHGWKWQTIARRIGGDGQRLVSNVEAPVGAWVGTCPNGHKAYRQRLTEKAKSCSCSKCSPRWSANYLFKWERNA